MSRYIITGATGYIGSNIVKALINNGDEVNIIVRPNSKLNILESVITKVNIFVFKGEIETLIKFFKPLNNAMVIHLGSFFIAEHKTSDLENLIDSNIKFGVQILEAMKETGIKYFINTGTSWQHYENSIYNPVCLYAATKEAFEKIIKYYYECHGIKSITLELFDTYGPDDSRPKLLNLLSEYSKESKVLNMSPGEQKLDLVYIDDVVDGYLLACDMMKKEAIGSCEKFVLSSGYRITLKELIILYEQITNHKVTIMWGERTYRNREVMTPWEHGTILPGWKIKVGLLEGLAKSFK
ncbi:MAG: NAD(P)-dependent oxidoreductase [Clostridium butyricum]|nr:NAD(P)-dependent oxidoreductase [Clostridium butyricum]